MIYFQNLKKTLPSAKLDQLRNVRFWLSFAGVSHTEICSISEDEASDQGLEIARELLDAASSIAPGFYIIPQLEKYEVAANLVQHLKQSKSALAGEAP